LRGEKSPYLTQHSTNPVDWYPWTPEAFEKARVEDKPVFLSIGYSTCHWCHVMERESFEDENIAEMLNDGFVSIKVDREERPDIDGVYMKICQAMTGTGGWPLTIIMTPDKKPFFAATYIPREEMFGRIGMTELLPKISEMWEKDREELLESAGQLSSALKKRFDAGRGAEKGPGREDITNAFDELSIRFDESYGGFSDRPKFPSPHQLTFLLRYWRRTGEKRALKMVEKTLRSIRLGGLFDQIGYGLHRYSTDSKWLVPHFEKMLYDQAMATTAYIEAFQATGDDLYRKSAEEIFEYVFRDMTDKDGGFYSSEDADSEGEEGKFYLWSKKEILDVLDSEDADLYVKAMNIREEGNYVDPVTGERTGHNIPHMTATVPELSRDFSMETHLLEEKLEASRKKLFDSRNERIRPGKDDKILSDWNGLMIASLAKGARAFGKREYFEAAVRSAEFIRSRMLSDGRLMHRYRDGETAIPGFLDDYAFAIFGMTEIYLTDFSGRHLNAATDLTDHMIDLFWDEGKGAFLFSGKDQEEILWRDADGYDGATPSGNSVAMMDLIRMSMLTEESEYERMASKVGRYFYEDISVHPSAFTQMMSAVDFAVGPSFEVVISFPDGASDAQDIMHRVYSKFLPSATVLLSTYEGVEDDVFMPKFAADLKSVDNEKAVYICENRACKLPEKNIRNALTRLEEAHLWEKT